MAKAARKQYPLSMRFREADIEVIDRAAARRGRTRSDFVREAAVRAAEEVLLDDRGPIILSPEDYQAFCDEIARPAEPVPEMVELFRRTPPWAKPGDG
jgi:uncharacterized protein (DUF1778 family)